MEKRKQVRRRYFLDKSFQLRYVAVIIIIQLCVAVPVGFIMSYLYLFVFNGEKIICQHNYALFIQWAILLGTSSIVLMIWGVVYTQRIIAPIYRIRDLLRSAALGDIPSGKIKFREKDKFKWLGNDLTDCFETMKQYKQSLNELTKNTKQN